VQLGADQVTYQYDAAGNVVQENGSRQSQWDVADQLRQFATWTGAGTAPTLLAYYVYAGGQRVKKLTQTSADTWQVTVYVGDGFEHRYEVSQGSLAGEQTQVAVLDGQHRLYQRRTGDALGDQRPASLYALDDHLGSTAAQTDAGGQLVSREEYYPFGETSFGSTQKQRYRFCGKELDEESGLYYYGMRYYAAWLCRFVSVDPLAAKYAFYTPYQYAGNRPINFIDLDGAEPATPGGGSTTLRPDNSMPAVSTRVALHAPPIQLHNTKPLATNSSAQSPARANQAVIRQGPTTPYEIEQHQMNQVRAKVAQNIANLPELDQAGMNGIHTGLRVVAEIEGAKSTISLVKALPKIVKAAPQVLQAAPKILALVSTARQVTTTTESLMTVYRGTSLTSEIEFFEETQVLMSDAARIGYREAGYNVEAGIKYSEEIHRLNLAHYSGDIAKYAEAHGAQGAELAGELGRPRTLISVTTDPTIAQKFSQGGAIFEGQVPASQLTKQSLPGATEQEYLLQNASYLFKRTH
jgi:RHS repeat-associated protein